MQGIGKKDNSTFHRKAALRSRALMLLQGPPVILETHAGRGRLFDRCYRHADAGVAIEFDESKATSLALQRPTWAVYQCDAERGLAAGLGSHLTFNFLDVDPYGQPWPTFEGYFGSQRTFADELVVVVNDGLRHKLRSTGGWEVASLRDYVRVHGHTEIYKNYLDVARELLTTIAGRAGYTMTMWGGYYCGAFASMTHYCAKLERSSETRQPV